MTASAIPRSHRLDLFLATFGILALELALIRWTSQQVRLLSYLNNVLLMAAFLGMGLGVALGRRRPELVRLTLPVLAVLVAILGFADRLRIVHLGFPDDSVAMFGVYTAKSFVASLAIIVALFILFAAVFLFAGTIVGDLFAKMTALSAYSVDLLGSLAGVVGTTIVASLGTPPPVWFAAGVVCFAWLTRRWWAWLMAIVVLLLVHQSVGGAFFSPYYRIDLDQPPGLPGAPLRLSVNRDFHQYMHDLSPAAIAKEKPGVREVVAYVDLAYRLPFMLSTKRERALVVGAGTGNDVAAALRENYASVTSVDIDPRIIATGRALHPERPYSDPRVHPVVNDARAYFEQSKDQRFDVVCFGLLDSHAMFSSMASLRLDNYVYTVESIRSAWGLVADGGVLSLSFAAGERQWIFDRLAGIVEEATGQRPLVVTHGLAGSGRAFIVGKNRDVTAAALATGMPVQPAPERAAWLRLSTDDWPFLYLRPGQFPLGYIAVLLAIIVTAVIATRLVYGRELYSAGGFDPALFLMGAAFLLLESRGVTDLSLLFGSTWFVNASVFAGILSTAWLANHLVRRGFRPRLELLFVALAAALALNYFVRPALLLDLGILARGILGGLLNGLPVGIAGVAFSQLLAASPRPDKALGSNLLGTVVGGALEYLSVFTGLRALSLVAIALYLGTFLLARKRTIAT